MQTEKLVQLEPYTGPTPDITTTQGRNLLSNLIKQDIDSYCKLAYDDGPRSHLGASEIGHKCSRFLWYKFRWMFKEKINGRQFRLFNRGHREEARFREWLEGIGATMGDSAYDQERMSVVSGHFGGSRDGSCSLVRYGLHTIAILTEYKTNGTGRGFEALSEGLAVAKPMHWAQVCVYGVGFKFEYALYLNINKNDDDLHVEVVKLDLEYGRQLLEKARVIIVSPNPPPKLSNKPEWYECSYCPAKGVCHLGQEPLRNCRSCTHAQPVENAEWTCGKWNQVIPKEAIPAGCSAWQRIA